MQTRRYLSRRCCRPWGSEGTFASAVQAANNADVGNLADDVAIAYYNSTNSPDVAAEVDSTRVIAGDGGIRIYALP